MTYEIDRVVSAEISDHKNGHMPIYLSDAFFVLVAAYPVGTRTGLVGRWTCNSWHSTSQRGYTYVEGAADYAFDFYSDGTFALKRSLPDLFDGRIDGSVIGTYEVTNTQPGVQEISVRYLAGDDDRTDRVFFVEDSVIAWDFVQRDPVYFRRR